MRIIKKITPESKQAEDPNQKNQKITILDQQGRFSSELRIDKESIEPVDLRRGGIGKPFLKETSC